MAHPKLVGDDSLVEELCKKIDAIEIYYPMHQPEDVRRYSELAKKYNLLTAGGSDFHGTASRYVKNLGDFTVDDEIAEKFYKEN